MTARSPSSITPHQVLVVTVSYHTAALVCGSLRALAREREELAAIGANLRVVVVDNDGGDAPALEAFVREQSLASWVSILRAEHNGGFAYGCNLGIRFGFESTHAPTHFYLLNPDAEVRLGAIRVLLEYLDQHSEVGVAGSILEEPDGTPLLRAYRFPSLFSELDVALETGLVTRLLKRHIVIRPIGDRAEPADWVSGAAMLIRRDVLAQVGGLDEAYFLYYEETDFCRKVRAAGWSIACVPASRVMHDAGAATGQLNDRRPQTRRPDYWFESRRRFFAKNYGVPYACATDAAYLAAHLLGNVKRLALGRSANFPPHFLRDFLRNSVLLPSNREIAPSREYRPPVVRTPDDGEHECPTPV